MDPSISPINFRRLGIVLYELKSEKKTLHGFLSANLKPVLYIENGDTVAFQTLEADWRIQDSNIRSSDEGVFFPNRRPEDTGHALCGPVFIREAEPGKMLAVTVHSIECGNWGWSRFGGGDPEHLRRCGFEGDEFFLHWSIDAKQKLCTSQLGHMIPLNPFMGVYTVAPPKNTPVTTHIPAEYGGNIDCKEIGVGATIYLPIFVEGGLFSTGDGHAAQGDGELSGTAIEAPIERVEMKFEVKDFFLSYPVCKTNSGWITFGFDQDLTEAAYKAIRNMAELLKTLFRMSYKEAIAISSLTVDLRVTQIVNGVKGIHAFFPHKVFNKI